MNIENLMDKFGASPLLVVLTQDQLQKFFDAGDEVEFKDGEVIVAKNSPGDALFLIMSGKVRISLGEEHDSDIATLSDEQTLHQQYEGDFFGEMALVDFELRSASVIAVGEVKLFRISRQSLFEIFRDDVDMQVVLLSNIARILARRLRRTNEIISKG